MRWWFIIALGVVMISYRLPIANADPLPVPGPPGLPGPVGGSVGIGEPGLGAGGPGLSPAAATIFLCPGVGGAASIVGFGGGYCDFNFTPTPWGTNHIHCEWGGANPLLEMWNCWRVFPGQPDHPAHPDPDIIPDGMGVPWAILGPSPNNQWPPPGLAPPQDLQPTGPPPGPPPEGQPPP